METEEQTNSRPWLYKKGQSGNPGGRPKGSLSLKTYIRNKLSAMTNEEREVYLEGLDKETIWRMAEGNPTSDDKVNTTIKIIMATEDETIEGADTDTEG